MPTDGDFDSEDESEDPAWDESAGCLGYSWDDDITLFKALAPLEGFPFTEYWELIGDHDRRLLVFHHDGKPHEARFFPFHIEEIIEALPMVEAIFHCPDDQGPAGGAGYGFFPIGDTRVDEITDAARALRVALDQDLANLRAATESL